MCSGSQAARARMATCRTPCSIAFWPRFIAGPNGCKSYMIMMGDPGSFPADPAGFERLRRERGVEQLPDAPLDLPEWFTDQRNAVTQDGS